MVETKFIDMYAKRLFFIVEVFKTKVVNLSFINEEVLEGLKDKGLNNLPPEFISTFKDLLNLNKLYEHMQIEKPLDQIDQTKDDENEISARYKDEHHELIEKIKGYCFYLCKAFKENHELLETLETLEVKHNHDFLKFLYTVNDLRDIFLKKFQTTASEKLEWEESLKHLKEEEIKLQEEEKYLNNELEKIRLENQKELTRLENICNKRRKELNDLKSHSEKNLTTLLDMLPKNDTTPEFENVNALYEKTKHLYTNQLRIFQDKEISSLKKNSLLETDIKNYIESIDAEILKKDGEIEKLQMELKKNRFIEKDLDNILTRKKKADEEQQYLNELEIKRRGLMQREEQKNTEAAIVIQSYIRAIRQRCLFAEHRNKIGEKKKKSQKK